MPALIAASVSALYPAVAGIVKRDKLIDETSASIIIAANSLFLFCIFLFFSFERR
jgi:hypothetical protein